MDLNLDILRAARSLAAHSADRQGVIAENIANADTPGYRARDLIPFSETYEAGGPDTFAMKSTRMGHVQSEPSLHNSETTTITAFGAESPNGNTVSLEDQMMRGVEVRQNHDLAMSVYRKTLDILRISIGT
ncbi:FlgB family protein [Algicella marina]|uniref:FlgB family protein n=1 Tax=Algicella marina TaxID=2683284 RepID=A0A6P1T3W9_9RHOB|nr:FlgB family protein [Algicella marina]QHQ36445.1 FlgB family protein [Algicella marina]